MGASLEKPGLATVEFTPFRRERHPAAGACARGRELSTTVLRSSPWTTKCDASAELRGAALFKLIWDAVSDVVGTTAAALVLRRAAQRATDRSPDLEEIEFVRTDVGYSYVIDMAIQAKSYQRSERCLEATVRPFA